MAPSGVRSVKYLSSSNGPAFLARYTAKPGISSLHANSYRVRSAAVRPNLVPRRYVRSAQQFGKFPADPAFPCTMDSRDKNSHTHL